MIKAVTIILILLSIMLTTLWLGHLNWTNYISQKSQEIFDVTSKHTELINLDEVNNLPDPVQKYFQHVLKPATAKITRVYIQQTGGFRPKREFENWSRMQANQFFSTLPRAFLWDARINVIPGIDIRVSDMYMNGAASMKGKLLSLFTMLDVKDQAQLNEAALQRYLAESVWFPTALLPSQGIHWTPVDSHRAKATVIDNNITATLEFIFNDQGEVISVYTPSRFREVSGHFEATPWQGHFSDYQQAGDYLIPHRAEVSWLLNDGIYTYWEASLAKVTFE